MGYSLPSVPHPPRDRSLLSKEGREGVPLGSDPAVVGGLLIMLCNVLQEVV